MSMTSGSMIYDDWGREFARDEELLFELLSGRRLRFENENEGLKSLRGGEYRRGGAVGSSICMLCDCVVVNRLFGEVSQALHEVTQ